MSGMENSIIEETDYGEVKHLWGFSCGGGYDPVEWVKMSPHQIWGYGSTRERHYHGDPRDPAACGRAMLKQKNPSGSSIVTTLDAQNLVVSKGKWGDFKDYVHRAVRRAALAKTE